MLVLLPEQLSRLYIASIIKLTKVLKTLMIPAGPLNMPALFAIEPHNTTQCR